MSIEQKIKEVVHTIPSLHYMYNDWATANLVLDEDRTQYPLCLHVLPSKGDLYLKNSNFRDKPHCTIAFLDLIPPTNAEQEYLSIADRDGEDTLPLIEQMKQLAKAFIVAVNRSGMFEPIEGNIPYILVYDKMDVGVAGVCLQIQLKELIGEIFCK